MAAQKKTILILGGSYGGTGSAHYLLRHAIPALPDPSAYQIVLVSPSADAMWRQACPRALISDDMFPKDKLFHNIPSMFAQYPAGSFRFVHGAATKLDHAARTVMVGLTADGKEEIVEYHALIIATGASTPSPLLGFTRDGNHLRQSWTAFRAALPTAKSIVIAGGGPAGVETAGELGEHLNGRAGWFLSSLANPKVPITLATAGPQILPVLRPEIARSAERLLAKVGVTVIKNARVQSVSPSTAGTGDDVATAATVTLKDGAVLTADLYIPATGTVPNTSFVDAALLAPDGRVRTDPATLRVSDAGERVYAVGDAASAFRPAVHLILDAVPVLCANVKRDLFLAAGVEEGQVPPEKTYAEDKREAQMVVVGRSAAVGALMGWRVPGWLMWLLKGRDYMLWVSGGLWTGKQWAKET